MKQLLQLKYIISLLIVLFLIGTSAYILKSKFIPEKKVHYHAGFVIIQDNKKIDFSDLKYMKVEPCTEDKEEEKHTEADEQIEKAHLHDNVGDVVHVENEDAKWKDLFTNLKYSVDSNQVKGYSNGVEIKNLLDSPIIPFQSIVIFIGNNDPSHLKKQVTLQYIKSKVKTSENCG